jgi:hypothetical protein
VWYPGTKSFTWFGAMLFALAISAPANAQFSMLQVPGFSNDYPWFNEAPRYQGNQSFQYFLAYHPNIARALSRNPGLLYNANWRSQVPAPQEYLTNHTDEWQQLLGPTLKPGDIVVLDNLALHQVAGITQAIAAGGARLEPLPPSSTRLSSVGPSSKPPCARPAPAGRLTRRSSGTCRRSPLANAQAWFAHCGYPIHP